MDSEEGGLIKTNDQSSLLPAGSDESAGRGLRTGPVVIFGEQKPLKTTAAVGGDTLEKIYHYVAASIRRPRAPSGHRFVDHS